MVSYMTQAVTYGLSRMLGIAHNEPVAHRDLEHAHWDPAAQQWFTHEDHEEAPVDCAA